MRMLAGAQVRGLGGAVHRGHAGAPDRRACCPTLLVKGGDYKPEQIAGYEAVTPNGGQVVVLDFHEGYSTTRLIEKAKL